MTEAQRNARQVFESVKDKAQVEKLARGITKYHYNEGGWSYDFFTFGNDLKKVEAFNHREFIEVNF